MDVWKRLFEVVVETLERFHVKVVPVLVRDGGKLYATCKSLCGGVDIDFDNDRLNVFRLHGGEFLVRESRSRKANSKQSNGYWIQRMASK